MTIFGLGFRMSCWERGEKGKSLHLGAVVKCVNFLNFFLTLFILYIFLKWNKQ